MLKGRERAVVGGERNPHATLAVYRDGCLLDQSRVATRHQERSIERLWAASFRRSHRARAYPRRVQPR
jgi:hypothetical protein